MTGLDDDIVIEGRRYFRLTEWRAVADGSARAVRNRHRATLEPQGIRTLERAVEIPGIEPGKTRVVVALFRNGEEASATSTARMRTRRTPVLSSRTSSPS